MRFPRDAIGYTPHNGIASTPPAALHMRLNPITKELFTDDGRFIKRMSCPYAVTGCNWGPPRRMVGSACASSAGILSRIPPVAPMRNCSA